MISLSINELKKWHFLLLFSLSKYFLNKNFYRKKCVFQNNEINFIEIICFETQCKWFYFFSTTMLKFNKKGVNLIYYGFQTSPKELLSVPCFQLPSGQLYVHRYVSDVSIVLRKTRFYLWLSIQLWPKIYYNNSNTCIKNVHFSVFTSL